MHGEALKIFHYWFRRRGWRSFPFQERMLSAYLDGYNGILNAPTGSGKTFAMFLPIAIEHLLYSGKISGSKKGLQVLWITPVRALTKDIGNAIQSACDELGLDWKVGLRTGDTSASDRQQMKKSAPQVLITTPESLHLILASKNYSDFFKNLTSVVVDEWHELLGSKRGTQIELALSRLRTVRPELKIWGISATIGNLDQALHVLLGEHIHTLKQTIVKSDNEKQIEMITILPDEIEKFPWAGHIGISLIDKIIPILHSSGSTLLFTNTRSQAEIWFQRLLDADPMLAGAIGLHHGSLDRELRDWVENALHEGMLKVVVCTSSLDLGVDFRPVDTVIQVGGPKGVARMVQRAGRSGHQPGAKSRIYFVPSHSLELMEASALRTAIAENRMESRLPIIKAFDVLIQYLVTLAVSDGFKPKEIFEEVINTHAYNMMTDDEWQQVLNFITSGGPSLTSYSEYKKVVIGADGVYRVTDRRTALRHRLGIGTIVSEAMITVKYMRGGFIGTIEENFIARLKPGDVFSFAGKVLELITVRDMKALVKRSDKKKYIVPQWMGGRMSLSSQLSYMIRRKLTEAMNGISDDEEMKALEPLFERQRLNSIIPSENQFLIECFQSKEGYHNFFYTFEGRYVNEGMAAVIAYRLTVSQPLTFSISMTDYGFELLTTEELDLENAINKGLFSTDNLEHDIQSGLNATEMARRRFRDIAHIAGLIFPGFPGRKLKTRHLQASSRLFFDVFSDIEPNNLLLKQAFQEVLYDQLDESRLFNVLDRIKKQEIIIRYPGKFTPLCFPILVEMFRSALSTEKLEDRVAKIISEMEEESEEKKVPMKRKK
jgi:ATP-dependent helicase Lhr and Lhr-like helicase